MSDAKPLTDEHIAALLQSPDPKDRRMASRMKATIDALRTRAEQAEKDRDVLARELRSIGAGWATVGKEVSASLARAGEVKP